MTALAPPQRLSAMIQPGNERYLAETGAILEQILQYAGRRIAPGLTVADLVWAIEAVESGYMLRRRSNQDVTSRTTGGSGGAYQG